MEEERGKKIFFFFFGGGGGGEVSMNMRDSMGGEEKSWWEVSTNMRDSMGGGGGRKKGNQRKGKIGQFEGRTTK